MTPPRQSAACMLAFNMAFLMVFYDLIDVNNFVVSALVSKKHKNQQTREQSNEFNNGNNRILRKQSDTTIHVGNLDWKLPVGDVTSRIAEAIWTSSGQDGNDTNHRMVEGSFDITVAELSVPVRKRDEGKFHRGSAKVSFSSAGDAKRAMDALLRRCSGSSGNGTTTAESPWKVRWDLVPQRPPGKAGRGDDPREGRPALSPAQQRALLGEHRRNRAEKYARKRMRVAESTDRVIESLLVRLSPADRATATSRTPVLEAPRLEWSACPGEIDPVRGGRIRGGTQRGERKRAAVEAFLAVLLQILSTVAGDTGTGGDPAPPPGRSRGTVADLGCGAGNLTIPLAWWLKQLGFSVLGVDINDHALSLLSKRADALGIDVGTLHADLLTLNSVHDPNDNSCTATIDEGNQLSGCVAVVSLHACGAASDLSLAAAVRNGLPFAISPCCIGKIGTERTPSGRMPPRTSAQRSAAPSVVSYPRSAWLRRTLAHPDDFQLLAAAADYGVGNTNDQEVDDLELARRKRCRLSKKVIEIDRLQWAKEHGYYIRLLEMPRIGPLYPKRELLLGAKEGSRAALALSRLPTVQ